MRYGTGLFLNLFEVKEYSSRTRFDLRFIECELLVLGNHSLKLPELKVFMANLVQRGSSIMEGCQKQFGQDIHSSCVFGQDIHLGHGIGVHFYQYLLICSVVVF